MIDVVVSVTLTDSEFTIGGIQAFLDKVRGIDEMPANAMVTVTLDHDNPKTWTLTASSGFRPHYSEDSAP